MKLEVKDNKAIPDFGQRTRDFSFKVLKFAEELPHTRSTDVLCRQLIRCATSIGANFRAAKRGKIETRFH
jgi:four helix bundle protein